MLIAAALAIAVLAVPWSLGNTFNTTYAIRLLHVAMLTMLVGSAFVLDDPARQSTAVAGLGATWVPVIRLTLALTLLFPVWTALLVILPNLIEYPGDLRRAGLAMEAPALAVWTWTVAAVAGRRQRDGSGGVVAGPLMFLVAIGLPLLPRWAKLLADPSDALFPVTRRRWLVLGGVGLVALVVAVRGRRPRWIRPVSLVADRVSGA